jgi:hypothetical protein
MDRKTRTAVTNQLKKLTNDILHLYPALQESPFLNDEQKELARNMERGARRLRYDLDASAREKGFQPISKMR